MNYLSIDYLIVYAFLGITLLIGVKERASKSFRDYSISNKRFGVGALIMTISATFVSGGSILAVPDLTYKFGIASLVHEVVPIILGNYLFIAFFIAPRIVHFKDCQTPGELMEVFYGKSGRVISGILSFYLTSSVYTYQIMWIGKLFENIGGIDPNLGVIVGGMTLAIYTARGGMGAVTVTDIFHFVCALGVLPVVAHVLLYKAGGIGVILDALSSYQLRPFTKDASIHANTIIGTILLGLYPTFNLSFPFIQRLLMAKHQGQSTAMYYGSIALLVPIVVIISLIGLAGIVLYPEPNNVKSIMLAVIENFPPGSRGLVWMTILGITISTADSFLHAGGIGVAHDAIKPLADRWKIPFNDLMVTKASTLLIACASVLSCLLIPDIFKLYTYGLKISGILFVTPLLGGLLGLKTNVRSFHISTIATLIYFIAAEVTLGDKDVSLVGSMMVSIFSLVGVHYYTNGGFVVINRSAYGQTTTVWHPSWQGARTTLASLIPTPQKVVRYFQQRVAENSSNTTTLALFVAVSYMAPLFMNSIGHPDAYEWLLVLRMVGALLCVGLLLRSIWSEALLPYFSTYYHLTLVYCFPFMTTFLLFLEGGTIAWVMNVMLSVMLFIMLLDYMTAIGLSIVGIALAVGVYKLGIGPLALSMDRDIAYMLAYGVGFSVTIGALFSRLRERLLRQANRRLVNQEAALEAHFPAVMAESERRAHAFQQMGVKGLLHTARKLHTIQHKTVEAQREQQALLTSLTQRQEALTQQQEALQANLLSLAQQQKAPSAEIIAQQQALAQQQQVLQAEFNALTQQQLAPQPELTAVDQSQAPQAELQTLAQHHLSPQAELNSLAQQQQDLQADLLPLVMQLQDLDTRGKDHLTLDVKKDLPIDQFLLSLQEKLLPRGIDVPLLTERKTKQTKLTADADQLAALLVKGIASLQWLIKDQDQYLLLGLEDTQLSYPLPDVAEGYVKQVSALRITLTATEELPPLAASYRPDLSNFIPEAQPTFQEMEDQADKRLIKAHYGYTEVSEDTLIYVIPVDVYEVRPLDMDKPALAIGALPERSNDYFKHETADAQTQEKKFLAEVADRSNADLGVVKLALNLIKWYHGPKKRHTQEPFYLHPLAVAQIVMDYDQDEATIVGALLHDTVEDTPMLMGHIEALFGQETAEVVDLVTHLQSIPGSMYKVKLSAEENLRMLGTTLNRRGLYVKIADRMHNMRTINGHPKVSKRKLVAQETIDFFVPLAKKLGLTEAAQEFEKMCEEVFALKE